MNILTFTTLYPNSHKPTFAIFVENRLRHLIQTFPVNSVVVAPVPWVPFVGRFIDKYKQLNDIPLEEERKGVTIYHPRFLHVPVIGAWLSPLLLAIGSYFIIKKIQKSGHQFDLIDAHYFYPDGVAAVILSKVLKLPSVITGRGSDVNVFPQYYIPRQWILWAAKNTDRIITVSQSLSQSLVKLGVAEDKINVLRNGVELDLFTLRSDRDQLRAKYELDNNVLICVGRLEELKGFDLVIKALNEIDDATLLIIGDGPLKGHLETLANEVGVSNRVRFLGEVSHDDLPVYYTIADVMVLASSREGWPNVLLESMACGTPVVATQVGGTPEVVASYDAGVLSSSRTVKGLLDAICQILEHPPGRENTRKYAEQFSWHDTSAGQHSLFKLLVDKKT